MAIRLTESRLRRIIREEIEEMMKGEAEEADMSEWSEWDDDDRETPEYGTGTWRTTPKRDWDPDAHDTSSKSGYSRPGFTHDDSDRYKSGYGS